MADLYNSLLPTGNNILNKEEEEDKTKTLIDNLPKDVSGTPGPDEFVEPEIKDEPVVPPLSKEEESTRPLVNQTEQLLSVVPPEEEKINSGEEENARLLDDENIYTEKNKDILLNPALWDSIGKVDTDLLVSSWKANDEEQNLKEKTLLLDLLDVMNEKKNDKTGTNLGTDGSWANDLFPDTTPSADNNWSTSMFPDDGWISEYVSFGKNFYRGIGSSVNELFNLELDDSSTLIRRPDGSDASDDVGYTLGTEALNIGAGTLATMFFGAVTPATGGASIIPASIAATRVKASATLIYRSLRSLGFGKKAAAILSPVVVFEAGYGVTKQTTLNLKTPQLVDLFETDPEFWTEEEQTRFVTEGYKDPEYIRRLKIGATDTAFGVIVGTAINSIIYPIATRMMGNKLTTAAVEMTGGGDKLISKQQRLETWLQVEKGFTPDEAIKTVSMAQSKDPELTLESILKTVDPDANLSTVDKFIIGNTEMRKIIYARNLVFTQMDEITLPPNVALGWDESVVIPMNSTNASLIVDVWKTGNILDKKIQELSGQAFPEVLEFANKGALRAIQRAKDGKSMLMGKTEETLRYRAEDINFVDRRLQEILTGVDLDGNNVARAIDRNKSFEFFDDMSQSPYMLAATLQPKIRARMLNVLNADNLVNTFKPVIPTTDGTIKYSNAKSLGNIPKDAGLDDNGFSGFLEYYRALKFKNDFVKRDITSPIPMSEVDDLIKAGDDNLAYQKALPDFSNLMRYLLDYSQAAGEISEASVKRMVDSSTNVDGQFVYIPRHIVDDEVTKGSTGSSRSPYQVLKGTESKLKDPFTDVVEQISLVIHKGEEQILKAARYKMIEKATNESGSPIIRQVAEMAAVKLDLEKLSTVWKRNNKARSKDMTVEMIRSMALNSYKKSNPDHIVDTYFDQGVLKAYHLKDPLLQHMVSLRSATKESRDGLALFLENSLANITAVTRQFSSVITKEPGFAKKSIIRDAFAVEMMSPFGFLPKFRSVKGLFAMTLDRSIVQEMRAAGFDSTGQINELSRSTAKRNVLDASGETAEEINKRIRGNFLQRYGRNSYKFWTELMSQADLASRAGEYMVAMKQTGMSPQSAAFFANDSSVNFGKRGADSVWNQFVDVNAFFRASYLGQSKTAEVIKNNPLKASMYLGLLASINNQFNEVNSMYPDFGGITERERRLWLYYPRVKPSAWLKWGEQGFSGKPPARDPDAKWATIPAPHELQVFANGMSRAYNLLTNNAENDNMRKIISNSLEGLILPTGSAGGLVPSILSRSFDISMNKSGQYGTPILTASQEESLFKEEVINSSTGDFAIAASEASKKLGWLFGEKDKAQFTPITAEYFARGVGIGVLSLLKNMLDNSSRSDEKGERMTTSPGDFSLSPNPLTWTMEQFQSVDMKADVGAGRGYKSLVYDTQKLLSQYRSSRKQSSKNFISIFGRGKVRSHSEEERMFADVSPWVREVMQGVQGYDTLISIARNDNKLSADQKLIEVRRLTQEQLDGMIEFEKVLERLDPERDMKVWDNYSQSTKVKYNPVPEKVN